MADPSKKKMDDATEQEMRRRNFFNKMDYIDPHFHKKEIGVVVAGTVMGMACSTIPLAGLAVGPAVSAAAVCGGLLQLEKEAKSKIGDPVVLDSLLGEEYENDYTEEDSTLPYTQQRIEPDEYQRGTPYNDTYNRTNNNNIKVNNQKTPTATPVNFFEEKNSKTTNRNDELDLFSDFRANTANTTSQQNKMQTQQNSTLDLDDDDEFFFSLYNRKHSKTPSTSSTSTLSSTASPSKPPTNSVSLLDL